MNRKQIFMIMCLVVCIIMSLCAVSASEDADNVTVSVDDVEPDILHAADESNISASNEPEVTGDLPPQTFKDLDALLRDSSYGEGSTIRLERDYYYDESVDTGYADGLFFIKNHITIDGQGHTIDGKNKVAILAVGLRGPHDRVAEGVDDVTIRNINFANANNTVIVTGNNLYPGSTAKDYAYGALQFWGSGRVENCNFTNNYALCAAALAIGASNDLVVTDCIFTNNTGFEQGGGAIRLKTYVKGLNITHCLFKGNYGKTFGGAVHLDKGSENTYTNIINCTFINNTAGDGAGGLFLQIEKGIVKTSRFIDNTAPKGGAIYLDGVNGDVSTSNFTHNNATEGGAIYCSSAATTYISTSRFANNTADYGGAVYFLNNTVSSIDLCSFYNNSAAVQGGSIHCTGKLLKVTNSNFTKDTATTGGGLYLDVGAYVFKCQFNQENAHEDGGGIYLHSKNITDISQIPANTPLGVFSTNFTACHADRDGGAGYVFSNYGVVQDTILRDCTANGDGGAGYIKGDYGRLLDSQLINNQAQGNGGALYWEGNEGSITNTVYGRNRAFKNGAGIYWQGNRGNITDCNFTINIANSTDMNYAKGGALYWQGSNGKIEHCDFDKSTARSDGAAVYVSGNDTDILNSNFIYYNSTNGSGGALYVEGNNVEIKDTTFDMGGVNRSGGAVYIKGSNVHIHDSTITHNYAGISGGSIYIEGDDAKIVGSTVMLTYTLSGHGGSIYIKGDRTVVDHSNFTNSSSKEIEGASDIVLGGAMYVEGDDTNITYARFQYASATRGGAIYIQGHNTHVSHSNFVNLGSTRGTMNQSGVNADAWGGAIYVGGDDAVISNDYFVQTNSGKGGAVYVAGNGAEISHSSFDSHKAINGGAIYIEGNNANITDFTFTHLNITGNGSAIYVAGDDAVISRGDFTQSQADFGGAIYVEGDRTEISHATFQRHGATSAGGAIYIAGDDTNITDASFMYLNIVGDGGSIYVGGKGTHISKAEFAFSNATRGGAIFIEGNDTVIESHFHHCFATNMRMPYQIAGGAIYVQGSNNEIRNSDFFLTNAINGVGGAIYAGGSNTIIDNITTNVTLAIETPAPGKGGEGGSIYVEGDNAKIRNSVFRYFHAAVNGGSLFVKGNNVTIYNCSLKNGNATHGGIIYIKGNNTNITYSEFQYATADHGGAIYINGSDTHVLHSNFTDLGAAVESTYEHGIDESTLGGAIFVEGDNAVLSYDKFLETNSGKGGAVYIAGSGTEISHSTFHKHNSTRGGAIYIEGDDANITNSSFDLMEVSNMGGAIYVGGVGTHITASNFTNNFALRGGAIFIVGNQTVIESDFSQCNAIFKSTLAVGGAIYANGTDNEIRNSNFYMTKAIGGVGGAIFVGGVNNRILNVYINETRSISAGGFRSDGGAIFVAGDNVTIADSTLGNFSAVDHGGAVYVEGNNANITRSSLSFGRATHGGAIYIEGSNTHVLYSNLSALGAEGSRNLNITSLGGAIYVNGNDTVISHGIFNKTNAGYGGAIYVAGERTEISHSSFKMHNSQNGGAIYIVGEDTNITHCNFTMLNISGDGGAIYVGGVGTHISSSNFNLTNATRGGSIFVSGSQSVIDSSVFNMAFVKIGRMPSAGGAIYVTGNDNEIRNSNISTTLSIGGDGGAIYAGGVNTAITHVNITNAHAIHVGPPGAGMGGNGGAIYISGDDAKVTDTECSVYSADDKGGAVYIDGEGVNITHSYFHQGSATRGGAIYIRGGDTHVDWVNVTRNTATANGGEFYIEGSGARISNSNLDYALAVRSGGAIFINGSDNLIEGCNVSYVNASERYGGGIFIDGENNNITRCFFEFCSSTKGGAIYINGTDARVSYSNFTMVGVSPVANVTNHTDGGAIYISGDDAIVEYSNFLMSGADHGGFIFIEGTNARVSYSNFTNSSASEGGGAIYIEGNDTVIEYSSFMMHTSVKGGAIYVNGTAANITDSNFTRTLSENGGGGAIYIDGIRANVVRSLFNQTRSDNGDGGAIYIAGENANVSGSNFTMIIADNGGVIYISGNGAIVEHSDFAYSYARVYGGSIYVAGNDALIDDSTFERHNATSGGTIYISGHGANITNSGFFRSLSLGEDGGAIYIEGDHAKVYHSVFDQTLSNMSDGGAIYIAGDYANVSDCNFNESIAIKNAKRGGNGGVLYIAGNNALVEYSDFSYSHAIVNGGSIYIAGNDTVIDHSTFHAHNATVGGSIYISGENANITYSNFTRSLSRDGDGGAIYIKGNNVDIVHSLFNQTSANNGNGGVIYIAGNYSTISESEFVYAFADKNGGVVYIAGQNNLIDGSKFVYNNATTGYGGSVYIWGGYNNITDSAFSNCSSARGGAIYIKGTDTRVTYSNFTRNGIHPQWASSKSSDGGAIYVDGDNAFISHGDFKFSIANEGGFIYVGGQNAFIEYSTFAQSTAYQGGGAIDIHGDNAVITESSFTYSNATKKGGAINVEGDDVNITNSNFTTVSVDSPSSQGGAIHIGGKDVDIINCRFNRTQAFNGNGGAIHVSGANANITDSTFELGSAKEGGAIYITGVNATVDHSSFKNNTAVSSNNQTGGGTIYLLGADATVSYSNFTVSRARTGGIIFIKGDRANITHSNFNMSMAETTGGAVYVAGVNATIDTSSFQNHNAHEGGAVFIAGSNTNVQDNKLGPHTYIYNSTFKDNSAFTGGAIYNAGGTAVVEKSNFTSNIAKTDDDSAAHGGAILWNGGSNFDAIINCYFEDNKAMNLNGHHFACGGAIYWSRGPTSTKNAKIVNSTFYNNVASRHGGAIDWYSSNDGVIENCSFISNTAQSDGGAIYAGDDQASGKNLTVKNCNFTANHANVRGGAISLQFGNSHILYCNFTNHTASEGGTLYSSNSKVTYCEYVGCRIINSKTTDTDRSSGNGGGAYITTKYHNFTDCEFINCSVLPGKDGGGIYLGIGSDYTRLEGCSFTNCTAVLPKGVGDGGAIYIQGKKDGGNYQVVKNITIHNSTFTNVSARNGGAIYMTAANTLIDNSTFINSVATVNGGAIYMNSVGDDVYVDNRISDATIRDGSAAKGGAIYMRAINNTVADSRITGNLAQNGAGIYLDNAANIGISNTNITNNNATKGSGMYSEASNYTLEGVMLLDNQALAVEFTNVTVAMDENGRHYLSAVFHGNDNLINAIWHDEQSDAEFTGVTYWNENGVATISTVPELSTAEKGQNITVSVTARRGPAQTVKTDKDGKFTYYFNDDGALGYSFTMEHPEDTYYTGLRQTVSVNATEVTIDIKDIFFEENATVNVTLKDRDGNNLSGNVTVNINDTYIFTIEVINGTGSLNNVSGIPVGFYNATVTFAGNDTHLGSSNSTTFRVKALVNVTLVKQANLTNVSVGDLVNYTITVTNYGPSNATNVTVTDVLPYGLAYVKSGSDISDKGTRTVANGAEVITWKIGNLTRGQTVTLWLEVRAMTNGTIGNVAVINSTEGGSNSSNTTNITVNPVVNLTVIKESNLTGNARVGDLVNFTITVTNHGPSNATNVQIVDELNTAFRFVKASGNIEPVNGKLNWTIDKILNGTSISVWVVVKVINNGTFTNMALVNSSESNKTSQNETNVTVDPRVNLTVIKKANVTEAVVGEYVEFTITVVNNGPSNATDVHVWDTLDAAFEFVNATGTYSRVGQKVNWTIDKIVNGTNATVYLVVKLVTNGTATNIAYANCSENKTDVPSNDTNVTVNPNVNLTIVKTAAVVNASVGDLVNFTIVVTNTGLSNATGVNVTDVLPYGMAFHDASNLVEYRVYHGTLANGTEIVTWHIPMIANGTSITLWIMVNLTSNGTFTNVAFAVSNENRTNVTNGTNITVEPVVDLVINKTVNVTNVLVNDLVGYTITVTNRGPSNATGVYVIDKLDGRLELISASDASYNNATGKWTIGNLAYNETVVLKLVVRVLTNGTIPNFANVTSNENDTNITNNNDTSDNVTVNPKVNLTVVKTSDVIGNASVGDLVNFTITVTNHGPSNATDVEIVDVLDTSFEYVDSYGGVRPDSGNVMKWTVDKIVNGTSASVWVQVRVLTNGTFTNVAAVNSTENSTTSTNDTNVTVEPKVNLTIIKKANVTNATVGDYVNFTITVINHGPSNATDVHIWDELDPAFEFAGATGSYSRAGQRVNWTIDKIVNGTNATLYLTVKLVNNGTVTNVAHVNCSENKTDVPSNDTNLTVNPQVNLTIVKTSAVVNASVGDLVNFTIVVTNNGLSNATGVNVTDVLPYAMAFMDASNRTEYNVYNRIFANGTGMVTWHIPLIANGTSVTLWILVNLTTNGTFTNVAFAVSNENRTNVTNGTNITVEPAVDIAINKTVNVTNVLVNDLVKYTITVTNRGPSNATGVYVIDKLDGRLELISASDASYNNATGKWTIGELAYNETATLTLVVRVLTNGTIPNFANVTSNENDTNITNNNDTSDNITVSPKVNLTVVKTSDVIGNVSVGDLVNFTITVTNHGPSNATNVEIVDALDASFEWVASYDDVRPDSANVMKWTIDKIVNGTSASVWVQVRVLTNGTFTNVAAVNSTENRTTSTNDTNVTVDPKVNLTVIKKANVTVAIVGDYVQFEITVINNGPSNATDVKVSDVLNPAFEFAGATGSYSCVGKRVNWTIDKIVNGTNATVYLTVRLVNNGTVTNIAYANCSENKTDVPSNDTNVTVNPQVNLTIIKTTTVVNASVGDRVNFTIVVTNNGLSNATDVNVTDVLPNGMAFMDASDKVEYNVYNRILANGTGVVTWHIPMIANGTSVTLWILVNLTTNGTFRNVAFAISNENRTNVTNGTDITVEPVVDLVINKTVNVTAVLVNDLVEYTITVTNNGPSNATCVYVIDNLDKRLQLISASESSYDNATGRWTIGNLAYNETVTLTLVVRVLTNGTIPNFANVTSNENDTNITNNNDTSDNVTVSPKVNLTVVKTSDVTGNVLVGDLVNFTITVTNHGPSNATNVEIVDELNEAFGLVSSYGDRTLVNGKITWVIPFIANGTSESVWVQVRVLTNGTFTNVAVVNSTENKTTSQNETNVTADPQVNLAIIKTTAVVNASVGDLVNFTIVVTNKGLSNATDVNVTDVLPYGMAFMDASDKVEYNVYNRILANGTGLVTWHIPMIANGTSVTLWILVNLTTNGTFRNVAFAASNENKTNATNGTNITVEPVVDLVINKTVNVTAVLVNDLVKYTITVTNKGPSNATGVYVIDNLDKRLQLINASETTYDNATGRWTIGNLNKGETAVLTLIVKVLTNGTVPNFANVTSNENDTNITNNNDTSDNVTVSPKVNLTVVKTSDVIGNVLVGDLVNFTITVTNHGPSNATNVEIVDELNEAFGLVSSYGDRTLINGKITWIVPFIANGTSESVWVQVRVLTNGTFTNVAVVNSTENKTTSQNETNVTADPQVNLTIIKTTAVVNASVGDLVNFTIVVTNNGLSNATDVNVTDVLPSGMTFMDASNRVEYNVDNRILANGTGVVTWHIPKIVNGTSVTLWILVNLTTNGTFRNVAFAASNENKTNATNGTNITVEPVVDLVINKTVNVTAVLVDDLVKYTIIVTNKGPSNATGVYVIDKLDKRLQLINASETAYDNVTGRWTIGNLNNGETVTLTLIVKVLTNGTVPNFANVTSNENDTNITNNNDTSDNVTVSPKVNLTVVKTSDVTGNVLVGDLVNFTITVTNHGPSNATNVEIVDELNEAFGLVSSYGDRTLINGKITWIIPFIANGTSESVWVQVRVLTNGTFTNVAIVNSTENKTTSQNETNITADPQVNLTIIKTTTVVNASVGDLVNFTIVVTNNGLSNATDVNVTDVLPYAMAFIDASNRVEYNVDNRILANGTGVVTWHIPKILNGTSVTLWILVNLTSNGTFTNVAFAASNENKTNATNGTNITAEPVVDLIINKTVNVTAVLVNDLVKYTITVTNKGPSNVTGVYVIDKLDKRLQLINASETAYDNATGRWTIGNLNNGESVTLTLVVKVLTNGTVPNFANVTSNENDTNVTNNNGTSDNVTVSPKVNLTVVKTSDVTGNVLVGDLVNFTITVTNHGPSNATNVEIVDELNEAFGLVSSYGDRTLINGKITWIIPFIANGTSESVWVQVRVLTNGTFTNVAVVNSTENKTTSQNETNVTADPQVNLTIIKSTAVTDAHVGDLVNFTIVVTNNGLSNATGVNVTDLLPSGMTFQDASNMAEYNVYNRILPNGTEAITWHIPKIQNGTSLTLWIMVNLTTNGTFTNVAFAASNENATNSTNSTDITVKPVVGLEIAKSVDISEAYVGDIVEYTIEISNRGPSNATGVRVTDELSGMLEYVDSNATQGRYDPQTNIWSVGNITAGNAVTLTIKVRILTNGTIANVATVNCSENATEKNASSNNITAKPQVNLTVVKTADISEVLVGDLVNFTITVTNNGISNATDVEIIDELASEFGYEDSNGNLDGPKVVWIIPFIENGTSTSVWVQVRVLTNGTFTNVAVAKCPQNTTEVTSNDTNVTVKPKVNLTVVKVADVTGNVLVGDLVNFTITVTNHGPSNATNVEVADELDNAFGFVNATGGYARNGQKVSWIIPLIENGTSTSVWVQVRVLTNGTFENVAVVNSTENKTTSENGTGITADPQVSLEVVKTADNATAYVGDMVNFTITVTNTGLSNATGVSVTDLLPSGMEYVDSGSDVGIRGVEDTLANGSKVVVWSIPLIGNSTNVTLWLQVRLTANGTFTNVALADSNENRTNATNGTDVTVRPVVNLSINKTVDKTNVTIGDTITYTITVKNNGPSNATNVEIEENMKGDVVIIGADPSKGDYSNGMWTISFLENGETATLTLKVNVTKAETVENAVIAKCSENSTEVTNASDNVTVNRFDTPMGISTMNITYGMDETITVTLPNGTTGVVNLTVDGVPYDNIPINDGVAEITIPDLDSRTYNVTAVYGGDANYNGNSTNATFKVSPVMPTIRIEVVDIWYGQVEVLNVTVNAPGYVNITANNRTITASLDHSVQTWNVLMAFDPLDYDGKATWNLENLKVGEYPVHAVYLGDENHLSVSTDDVFRVLPLPSQVNASADDIYVGEDALIKVSVTPNATGNVTVTVDGRNYTVNITNGSAEIRIPGLKAGEYDVKVRYNGDGTYLPSDNSTSFKVKKIKPPIDVDSQDIYVGEDEKITVTLPEDATGKVTITVDGRKYTANLVGGKAEFTVPGLKAGKYRVDAEYSGDDKYLPTSGSDDFRVLKVKPDVDVDAPDITVGEDGKITVTLPEDATGTVTIEVEGKRYTAPVKNGRAVFRVPGLKVGVHGIKVWYSGDDKYLPGETDGDIHVLPAGDDDNHGGHPAKGLEKHATGNPIWILIIAVIAMAGSGIRKFRK